MYERDNEKLQELADGMMELQAMIDAGNKKIKAALRAVTASENKAHPKVRNLEFMEEMYHDYIE
jgi:endonuclease III